MKKQVEVCVEGAADGTLSALYDPEELKGKTFADIAADIVGRDWSGNESRLATSLGNELSSRESCRAVVVRKQGTSMPVRLPGVELGTPIAPYVTQSPERDTVYVQVLRDETVGYH